MALKLYHSGPSTCSQKVRLVLAEKGLDFDSEHLDLLAGDQQKPDYVKLNPNAVVPTLVHDGAVLIESGLIIEYLDDAFPQNPLRPEDPVGRHAVRLGIKQSDAMQMGAGALTFSIGPRQMLLQRSEEEREAYYAAIPDPARRAMRRSVVELGVKSPEFKNALGLYLKALSRLEETLQSQDYISSSTYSLADVGTTPYILRMDQLAMTSLLPPAVTNWYERIRARPNFESAVTKWVPEPMAKMLKTNGEAVWPEVQAIAAELS